MKRIIVLLVLMMIGIYGIAEEIQKDVNSASYNEFLEYFKTDLEAFSHRFSDFDSISEELKKGIFGRLAIFLMRKIMNRISQFPVWVVQLLVR